ncbi:MAG: preprotein translocase subunit SecF [Frankiaceae bacterium]|jgi:preprotein translocase subunit SecF|nr:preprotein translocase subunit SecF [Frankiaceae bacterium]
MAKRQSLATRLYNGQVSYDFIGKRRRWYAASGLLMLISIISLLTLKLDPSVDFKGGDVFQFPQNHHSQSDVVAALAKVNVTPEVVQVVQGVSEPRFRVETKELPQSAPHDVVSQVEDQLSKDLGISVDNIDVQTVGSTWGSQITKKAITGLIVFLIAVIIYLSFRFEWKMALAAIIALLHDLLITAGIYSLSGFEVSPSTVIALLTILGYSLYDTVVVFDKVRENTVGIVGGSRMTYSQAANLAVNQTLVRSINTSIIALLPVAGLLIIGAGLLGAGSLKDLALALLIGLAAGAYSSIFIATPLVCDLKEREPAYKQLARRVAARQSKDTSAAAAKTAAPTWGGQRTATATATATAPATTDDVDDAVEPVVPVAPVVGPRPGSRPGGQARKGGRGGRPGARSSKKRKRR